MIPEGEKARGRCRIAQNRYCQAISAQNPSTCLTRVNTFYEKVRSPTKSGMDDPVRQRQSPVGGTSGTRGFAGALPAICDFSIPNVCNAACDFCGFSRDKRLAGPARYVDPAALTRALPILRRRGIRFMTLQGGEPLVHPDVVRLVSEIATTGASRTFRPASRFDQRHMPSIVEHHHAREAAGQCLIHP